MPDNLTISISANTAAAEVNIAKVEARLRALTRERRKAADEFEKTGDDKRLTAVIPQLAATEKQLASLRRETEKTSSVMDVLATKSMRRLLTQFDNVGKSAQNIAMVMGGVTGSFAGGFLAASVFKGLGVISELLADVNKKLRELRETARETGQRPAVVEAARRIVQSQGLDASVADKIMSSGAEDFAKAKTEAGKPISLTGVKDLTDRTLEAANATNQLTSEFSKQIATLRGSSPILFDLAKAYDIIGVKAKDYQDTVAGEEKFNRDRMVAFVKLAESGRMSASQLNELSKVLFKGLPADSFLEAAPKLIANLDAEIKRLGDIDARIKLSKAADAARGQRNQVFSDWFDSIVDFWNRMDIAANNWQTNFLTKTFPEWLAQLQKDWTEGWDRMWAGLPNGQDWMDRTKAAFAQMWEDMKATATAAADAIAAAFNAAKQTLSTSFPGDPGGFPAMPGNAAGGMIRGPGSGTSDSILARLSNGEFVMRARAVEHWGPRFMAALNNMQNPFGYRSGGLVPRFAAGGMVSARTADGVTVNLTFAGGGTFALRGDAAIVGGLTREARRAGMLSAGRLAAAIN